MDPTFLWLSTNGITNVTFGPLGDSLRLALSPMINEVRFTVATDSDTYSRQLPLRPGHQAVIEPPGWRVVVERVVVPEGCHVSGEQWRCTFNGRRVVASAHARIRVEAREDVAVSAGAGATPGCGEPGPGPVRAPPDIERPTHDFSLPVPRRGRVQRRNVVIERIAEIEGSPSVSPPPPQLVRIALDGDPLAYHTIDLDVMPEGERRRLDQRLFVREGERASPVLSVWTMACARVARLALEPGSHHFWVGTDGYERVSIDAGGGVAITATLGFLSGYTHLQLHAPSSSSTVLVRPTAVGRSFELDGVRFTVVSIVPSDGTVWTGDRYRSDDHAPHLLVGVQVER